MTTDVVAELNQLTVTEIAAGVARGAFTPSDVAEAYLSRVAAVEERKDNRHDNEENKVVVNVIAEGENNKYGS